MKFPLSADDLVDELDRAIPEVVPKAGDSMEAIQRNAGKRELVLYLKHLRELARKAERSPSIPRPRR